jgi:chemotaxis protein CheC
MKNLTTQEVSTAKDIIDLGLKKAAESLSFFMKEPISLKEVDFNVSNDQTISIKNTSSENNLYILSTEMKGELKGICFLVFNQEEKDEICKVALPPEIYNNPDKLKNMEEPLLLEVDNIISASVITQIANKLKQKVYGDVPKMTMMNAEGLKNAILEQMSPDKFIIGFQTEFISSKSNFNPEFFWVLDPKFFECVKQIVLEQIN